MKERLLLLSDLWGGQRAQWVEGYQVALRDVYEVKFYDFCVLGQVDSHNRSQENLHEQFISGGIEKAVDRLLELELGPVTVIGCSIGGVIAWKAGLKGLQVKKLLAVSSTRLRYEDRKPETRVKLYFGEHDEHRPGTDWLDKMNVAYEIIAEGRHDIYKDSLMMDILSRDLIG